MKKKKWEKELIFTLFLAGCLLLFGCQGETEILTTTEQNDFTKETESSEEISDCISEATDSGKEIDWTEEIFAGESVFITYPVFSLEDKEFSEQINQKEKEDALRILEYFDVDVEKDLLDITYEIADITKDWISIVYCGSYSRMDAAYPTEVCYTSNLSLKDGSHLRVSHMEQPERLAGQIGKGEYRIIGEEEELTEAVRNQISALTEEELISYLMCADFGTESYESYPDWFSFWSTIEEETHISLVIPVPHVLGDYAVLEFSSE